MNTKEIEQMKEHIEKLDALSIAMEYQFLKFVGAVNRAVGAKNVSETFSPFAYVNSAEKSLKEIENAIKNYRQNQSQDFEVAPKSIEDIASEVADVIDGLESKILLEDYIFRVLWTDHSTYDVTLRATDLSDAVKQFKSKYGDGNNAKWLSYQIINHEYVLN